MYKRERYELIALFVASAKVMCQDLQLPTHNHYNLYYYLSWEAN